MIERDGLDICFTMYVQKFIDHINFREQNTLNYFICVCCIGTFI